MDNVRVFYNTKFLQLELFRITLFQAIETLETRILFIRNITNKLIFPPIFRT